MRLVVDTSVLVGELLRASGRERLGDDRLDLILPEQMWGEAKVELPKRIAAFVRRRSLEPSIGDVVVVDQAIYSPLQEEADRICARDPAVISSAAGSLAGFGWRGAGGTGHGELPLVPAHHDVHQQLWPSRV